MKKLLALAVAAAALAMASCGGKGISADKPGFDTLFTAAQSDSMIRAFAITSGCENNLRFDHYTKTDPSLTKKAFFEGFRYAFKADTASAFQYGIYTANQVSAQLNMWHAKGVAIDRDAFLSLFKKYFLADSVSTPVLDNARDEFNAQQRKLNEAMRAYEAALVENSSEALANVKAGQAYIDSVAAADPEVKVKASGLAIKVLNPGTGDKVKTADRVVLHYTSSTPAGRTFDRADANNARPVAVSTRIEGLQQALQELGQGGKAIVYIPGKLAYGTNINKRYRLDPNQLVIMDVEVVEVIPAAE